MEEKQFYTARYGQVYRNNSIPILSQPEINESTVSVVMNSELAYLHNRNAELKARIELLNARAEDMVNAALSMIGDNEEDVRQYLMAHWTDSNPD